MQKNYLLKRKFYMDQNMKNINYHLLRLLHKLMFLEKLRNIRKLKIKVLFTCNAKLNCYNKRYKPQKKKIENALIGDALKYFKM
jgi:hypothetical protein